MTKIFGREAEHEMFSVQNGLLMSTPAGKKMDKELFVIVPYANDESESNVREWHLSHPKRYKIRVLDKSYKEMLEVVPGSNPKFNWAQLDGRELGFLSDHRPRARYLYYRREKPASGPNHRIIVCGLLTSIPHCKLMIKSLAWFGSTARLGQRGLFGQGYVCLCFQARCIFWLFAHLLIV